ncbi:MAG: TcpQ domain-containing protein [Rhodospirillales bacterium]|nr:TcpQ domain-containing protein [Rhodospirillales bacterium]MDE0377725.1 TcpQ domain-containing protein [Rhodospirillales bacterium]
MFAAVCFSAAGDAGFLYVPQDEAPPVTVEATGSEAAESALKSTLEQRGNPGPSLWHVHSGEMLRDVMSRWGGRAGVEVVFLTDRRYRLHEGRTFAGAFEAAAETLFAALSHLPHPPVGAKRWGGRTYAVLHRVEPGRAGTVGDAQ